MKSKAPLAMMEQMVMLLVFALAAALCLQAFVKSDALSRRGEDRDRAVVLCQTAAEAIRHSGGDTGAALAGAAGLLEGSYAQGVLRIDYGRDWSPNPPSGQAAYCLTARSAPSQIPGLCKAQVAVLVNGETDQDAEVLFELEVAWQEVGAYD